MTERRFALPAAVGDRLAALPRFRRWALTASAGWAVVVIGYAIGFFSVAAAGASRGTLFIDAMFFLATLTVPLVLVWLAAWLAEELETQRLLVVALAEAVAPLIEALAATRAAVERHGPTSPDAIQRAVQGAMQGAMLGQRGPDLAAHLDRLQGGQARLEAALQKLAAAPQPAAAPEPEPERAGVVGTAAEPVATLEAEPAAAEPAAEPATTARPDWRELIKALDFPRDAEDQEGFRALRMALRHHRLALTLQAAEDVLNLLSQEGVFVDELAMEPVDAAAWRRFMAGVRGPEVAGLGGIRDERALETARGLMKSDSIFRNSALFFQRRFDGVLREFAGEASDTDIDDLAGTRSGRAFMLLARLSGSLD